jgi:Putative Flp pilus-assembly TadE/G-like
MRSTMNRRTANGERGAILAQVAISMLMLMGFAAFVLDYGVVLVSRGQAQNSADAGALAGAISRAFDDITNPPPAGGVVELAATDVAQDNLVWNSAGSVAVSYACPPGVTGGGCVRVDVYRNGELASPTLPVLFAPVLGITSQGVRATATAQATSANGADCLKPWAVADKWLERDVPPWTQLSTFDPGNPTTDDVYIPPYSADTTGFKRANASGNPVDTGYQMTLKLAHPGPAPGPGTFSSGWAMSLYLPNTNAPGEGATNYEDNIINCTTATIGLATQASTCPAVDTEHGCLDVMTGAMTGKTKSGVDAIVARDSLASWTGGLGGHISGGDGLNERVVPIALFDTALYLSQGYNGTNGIVKLVGILGFFVEGLCEDSFYKESYLDCSNNNKDVVGRLVSFPGIHVAGAGENTGGAAFGMVIRLVR